MSTTKRKNLIIFPKGTLAESDKRALQRDGYLPIETDDPSRIVIPDFTPSVQTKDLLLALADGVASHNPHSTAMVSLLKRLRMNLEPSSIQKP